MCVNENLNFLIITWIVSQMKNIGHYLFSCGPRLSPLEMWKWLAFCLFLNKVIFLLFICGVNAWILLFTLEIVHGGSNSDHKTQARECAWWVKPFWLLQLRFIFDGWNCWSQKLMVCKRVT